MDANLIVAFVSALLAIGMAALMVIYPSLRLLWWAVISLCTAGATSLTLLYFIHKYSPYWDEANTRTILVLASGIMGFLLILSIMLYFDPNAYRTGVLEQEATAIKTGIRLQFFGDRRIPTEVSNDNIAVWFAYFTPSLSITPKDAQGNTIAGGIEVPPNWVIFLLLQKPAVYRQVIVDFSNPQLMPVIDRQMMSVRAIIISTRGQIPAGVLHIHTE